MDNIEEYYKDICSDIFFNLNLNFNHLFCVIPEKTSFATSLFAYAECFVYAECSVCKMKLNIDISYYSNNIYVYMHDYNNYCDEFYIDNDKYIDGYFKDETFNFTYSCNEYIIKGIIE